MQQSIRDRMWQLEQQLKEMTDSFPVEARRGRDYIELMKARVVNLAALSRLLGKEESPRCQTTTGIVTDPSH